MRAPDYFNEQQRQAIKDAIEKAELTTSGELRVFVDDHCHNTEAIDRAIMVFEKTANAQNAITSWRFNLPFC